MQKPHIGGTIGYFSPDVLFTGSKERGFETDAWSLALLILEMATAGKPSNPQAENVTDLLWLHFVDMCALVCCCQPLLPFSVLKRGVGCRARKVMLELCVVGCTPLFSPLACPASPVLLVSDTSS